MRMIVGHGADLIIDETEAVPEELPLPPQIAAMTINLQSRRF